MLEITTASPEETKALGERLGQLLQPGDILCLQGDLGAGKTLMAKGIALGLDIAEEEVTSPTFTLINEYQGRLPFYHMDVYRLDDPEAMYDLGLEEYFYDQGVTLVEWADKLGEFIPQEALFIDILVLSGESRKITLRPQGQRYQGLLKELK